MTIRLTGGISAIAADRPSGEDIARLKDAVEEMVRFYLNVDGTEVVTLTVTEEP